MLACIELELPEIQWFDFFFPEVSSHVIDIVPISTSQQKVILQGTGHRDSTLAAYRNWSRLVHHLDTETYLLEDPLEMTRASPWMIHHPES